MAPIRRYLRITKFSVLECRIYLDNPSLAETWLLNPRDPVLPRVVESVRSLVPPKLREENERSKGKGSKKKGVKDVVETEEFEVSVFLTETSTRHSLLTKHKSFRDTNKNGLRSNSSKLTGATNDTAIEVDDAPTIAREDSEELGLNMADLPDANKDVSETDDELDPEDSLFVTEDHAPPRSKRSRAAANSDSPSGHQSKRRRDADDALPAGDGDEKKKMAMDTSYEGFAIYGRVLCLVVRRKEKKGKGPAASNSIGGQATMENWITTQIPPAEDDEP